MMSKFKEMKIEINKHQTLNDVLKVLYRLGYEKKCWFFEEPNFITTSKDGKMSSFLHNPSNTFFNWEIYHLKDL